jgi:nucleoside-diphosphate-sugar epimerase
MTVLVIGGAGYVGSHMVHALVDAGEHYDYGNSELNLAIWQDDPIARKRVVPIDSL